jgi:hypothetical protein
VNVGKGFSCLKPFLNKHYYSFIANIMIKPRRMRWADHEAGKKEMKSKKKKFRKPERKRPLGRLRIDGKIIFKLIL